MSSVSQRMLADVRENIRRLDTCTGHQFTETDARPLKQRYTCSACKGEIEFIAHLWYQRGVKDGRQVQ